MRQPWIVIVPLAALGLWADEGIAQSPQDVPLAGLQYRGIGPALMGGRISDLAVVESKPQTFYLGTATGGLWKTENHGTSWTPLFDDQPTSSIGDVTIHQANPNLVWVGTGEPQNRQSSPWGNGVYKSTDGGRTWRHMGLEDSRHVGRILIHPRDPDVVYVAAVGNLWGPNEGRGVFRTQDGGESWEKVLYVDEHTGAIDLAMDPADPKTIFAAMYQRQRTGWGFNGGGPGSGLYRTMDGGDSWSELTEGLPGGDKGRIGVDVFRRDGNLVYALVEADAREPDAGFGDGGGERKGGLFRSTDRGATWEKVSDTNPRPMYYSQVRIDPSNPDRIYVLGTQLMVSDDGGKTFRSDGAVQIHVDHHALWIDPEDPDHLILGSDGGVSASWDGTKHWRMFDNIPLGQFYAVGYDMRDPYYVCGGLQDNDPWCGPSNTRSFHGIRNQDWYETAYGDGFFTIVDPTDSTIVFSETQGGNMNRYDVTTGEKTPMQPVEGPRAEGDTAKEYRFNWNAPLAFSPHDPATIYLGANYLLRSRDRGMSWDEVGGVDLTREIDRGTLEIMGVPGSQAQLSINDGISSYGNLTTLSESPLTRGLIYVGTDDGNVQVTRDDGDAWENVAGRIPGLPERTYVSRVQASAHVEGRVYATFDGHRNGDFAPYAYVSEDYGQSWRAIADGLPDGWSVNVILEHPGTADLLFLGNEVGVYVSVDRGASWTRLEGNLPTVPVDDLLVHPRENDLIVGTHGRSLHILPDVAPLEALAQGMLTGAGHVLPTRSVMWARKGDWPFYGATYSAPNPPRGARIRYYLRDEVSGEASVADGDGAAGPENGEGQGEDGEIETNGPPTGPTLTVVDSSGEVIRTLDAAGSAGINEVIWDWRLDPAYEAEDDEASLGPVAMPGRYEVRLEVGEGTFTSTVELVAEPRRPMTPQDRAFRQDVLMSLHVLAGAVHEAQGAAQDLEEQLASARSIAEKAGEGGASALEEVEAMEDGLDAVDEDLSEALRVARQQEGGRGVASAIQGSSTRPTEDQLWQVDDAWSKATAAVERLNELAERMEVLNASLFTPGVRPARVGPLTVPSRPRP